MASSAGTKTMRLAVMECGAMTLHEATGLGVGGSLENQISAAPAQPSQHTTLSSIDPDSRSWMQKSPW
jgi:hypothetical protein